METASGSGDPLEPGMAAPGQTSVTRTPLMPAAQAAAANLPPVAKSPKLTSSSSPLSPSQVPTLFFLLLFASRYKHFSQYFLLTVTLLSYWETDRSEALYTLNFLCDIIESVIAVEVTGLAGHYHLHIYFKTNCNYPCSFILDSVRTDCPDYRNDLKPVKSPRNAITYCSKEDFKLLTNIGKNYIKTIGICITLVLRIHFSFLTLMFFNINYIINSINR